MGGLGAGDGEAEAGEGFPSAAILAAICARMA